MKSLCRNTELFRDGQAQADVSPILLECSHPLAPCVKEERDVRGGGCLFAPFRCPDIQDRHGQQDRDHRVRRKSRQGADDSVVVKEASRGGVGVVGGKEKDVQL